MQNLVLQGERRFQIPSGAEIVDWCDNTSQGGGDGDGSIVVLTADGHLYDSDDHTLRGHVGSLVTTSPSHHHHHHHHHHHDWFRVLAVSSSSSSSSSDNNSCYVCLSQSGAVVTFPFDLSSSSSSGELVGEFEYGICAAAWDGELLVLITTTTTTTTEDDDDNDDDNDRRTVLLTMNSEWHVLAEVELESPHDPSFPVFLAIQPSSNNNATLCAVSSVDRGGDTTRKIRFYQTSDLAFQSLGRTEDGSGKLVTGLLAAPLAWAGHQCSQLLATLQTKGRNKKQVAFLEPNGLRHGEFVLPDVTSPVLELCWNADSQLLAVVFESKIQLWHRRNYHWYLKREIHTPTLMTRALFHPENPRRLFVALQGGQWMEYHVQWCTSTIAWPCTALVVDGASVKVTPLDRAITPPPMSEATLVFPHSVQEIAAAHRPLGTPLLCAVVLLVDGSWIVVCDENGVGHHTMVGWNPPTTTSDAVHISDDDDDDDVECPIDPCSLRNLVISSADAETIEVVAACMTKEEGKECLVVLTITWGGLTPAVTVQDLLFLDEPILTITAWSDAPGALVELNDGSLYEYYDGQVVPATVEPFLEPCHWIEGCKVVPENDHGHNRLVVGKTLKGRLYCHDVLLAENVSSFFLSVPQGFLCYVTADSQFQLRFVHLSVLASFDPLLGSEEHQRVLSTGYEPRDVERGACLVCVRPEEPTVVLQMPRGNLEAIYPRALVLGYCMKNVLAREFKSAYELMRRHKVDLNLIVDLDPHFFLKEGVHILIDQVRNIDHLNLFISSLQNWNSTLERYPVPKWIQKENQSTCNDFDFTKKVNLICESMRTAMLAAEAQEKTVSGKPVKDAYFLLPTLSTFAKQDPPQIEDALNLIKNNTERQRDTLPKNKPILFSDKAQSAIQYLAFMAEYSLLFDRALGLYDFDMARAVARNSQMDPKVYLPLLKRYMELPLYYARYEVDMRLKNYDAALRNLAKSLNEGENLVEVTKYHEDECPEVGNNVEDCMQLIEKHDLYRQGLELFQDPQSSRTILIALGDDLMKQKRFDMALNVFLTVTPLDVERAKSAAKACRDWKTLFSISPINEEDFSQERKMILAGEMAENLSFASESESGATRRQKLNDAATILYDYGNDVSGAVEFLLRAELWFEAQRLSVKHSLDHRRVMDAVIAYTHKTIEDLEEKASTFPTTLERYSAVVQIRREAVASGEVDHLENDPDENGSLFTTASTTVSNASMRSTGTSTSLSSVISVKTATTFSLSGADEHYRHKSKFNQLGFKKKKKRKSKGSTKVRPGSQAELDDLVGTLRSSCLDPFYAETIGDTICFLFRNGQIVLARILFTRYSTLHTTVTTALSQRQEAEETARRAYESRVRREGFDGRPWIRLELEQEVDKLMVPSLPPTIADFFRYIPETSLL
ncbi:elongator complex protein 1 [Fistulifera solaris]|uniref:Elongator complex protein 1 n=1 Tax=Fistulifera solaris TaxID=1519565 RepID=A0A1Z5J6Z6_FISSO|nr:elongator complex protein 1 [Fistulifera solaris]|eukprot:GAX09682.1 elongator complex protein 1 [Fistulifera solaris]